jgi:hypothetical protein
MIFCSTHTTVITDTTLHAHVDNAAQCCTTDTAQLTEHKAKADSLSANCESFGMAPPRFESIAATAVDIEGTVSSWSLLREYTAALKLLADQDWIRYVTQMNVSETVVY